MTKIFYGNQFVEKFNCDGSKKSDRKEAKRFIRNSIIALFVMGGSIGILAGGYKIGALSNVQIAFAEKEVDVTDIKFSRKIEELQMKLVEDLMNCESNGATDDSGLITYDPQKGNTNASKIPSIGRLQFKVDTVVYYQKTLYNAVLTRTEAIKLALDTEKAKVLARDIIFSVNKGGINNWYNCSVKLNLEQRVEIIKQLSK